MEWPLRRIQLKVKLNLELNTESRTESQIDDFDCFQTVLFIILIKDSV